MTRRYAGTHCAAAPPRRLHWRRASRRMARAANGREARGGWTARPRPAPLSPRAAFPAVPALSRGGWGRGGVGAGPNLINQRLLVDAGGGDAIQGGKKGRAEGAGAGRRARGGSFPPSFTQLIGLRTSAWEGIGGGGTAGDWGRRPSRPDIALESGRRE